MKFSYLIILLLIAVSCETVVTDDLTISDTTPLLVVEGGIERYGDSTGVVQQVRLTTTNNFLEDAPNPVVEDAQVTISDGPETYPLTYQGDGVYTTTEVQGEIGRVYTLEVNWEGAVYRASDRLTEVPRIDSIYADFEEASIFTDEGYFVKIDARDPAGVVNFYHYRVYRDNELITVPDPGNSRSLVLDDDFFDGQPRLGFIPNEEVIYEVGNVAMVDQMGISEAYFDFLFQVYEQTGSQGGFVGNPPPSSIRGNVNGISEEAGRALGFFYAADVYRDSIMVVE
ncbi:MAG: DUF4249 domain-containing protein [Bacteroidota bacterium]